MFTQRVGSTGELHYQSDEEFSKTVRNPSIVAASALSAVMLAGCVGVELQNVESLAPSGSAFDKDLFEGYVSLAKAEDAEGDYRDSDAFSVRAAQIFGGRIIAPEEISMRTLPKAKLGEMTDARKRLVAALDSDARGKAPADAAKAQVMFDCWMQEQEENFQPADIAHCKDGFMAAMARVEAAMKPAPKPAPEAVAQPATQTFIVYFPFDSDKMTPASQRLIRDAIDAAKSMSAKRISVYGHADTAGTERYNAALSAARTQAVAEELAKGGFELGRMDLGSFGESTPAVATGDGVRSQQNRRAMIQISK